MPRYITPLRYPGGKQRLAPFVAELITANDLEACHYAEPYAGGAGIALELLFKGLVSHVHLNDRSENISAFWRSILTAPDKFCRRIAEASLSIEDWKLHREVVRNPKSHDEFEVGFSTFYLNRCNRSGILTAGVIGGQLQTGRWRIDARFPRNELIQRIELIATKADRISVTGFDAEVFMTEHASQVFPPSVLFYCDPPYYERSARLYLNSYSREDHARLAVVIQEELAFPWIVSYDSHPNLVALYAGRQHFRYSPQYSAIQSYKGSEVFIISDKLEFPRHSSIPAIRAAVSEACGLICGDG